jgi:hypothetical protein
MSISKHWKLGAVAVSCAAIGAGASAIANAGAATSRASSKPPKAAATHRALLRRAVHGDVVVATKTGYATATFDRGTVKSVSGQQLTLADGRAKATPYKTVTLTIPSSARVRDDRHKATLADVKPGQRAAVIQEPNRTIVIARDAR